MVNFTWKYLNDEQNENNAKSFQDCFFCERITEVCVQVPLIEFSVALHLSIQVCAGLPKFAKNFPGFTFWACIRKKLLGMTEDLVSLQLEVILTSSLKYLQPTKRFN